MNMYFAHLFDYIYWVGWRLLKGKEKRKKQMRLHYFVLMFVIFFCFTVISARDMLFNISFLLNFKILLIHYLKKREKQYAHMHIFCGIHAYLRAYVGG